MLTMKPSAIAGIAWAPPPKKQQQCRHRDCGRNHCTRGNDQPEPARVGSKHSLDQIAREKSDSAPVFRRQAGGAQSAGKVLAWGKRGRSRLEFHPRYNAQVAGRCTGRAEPAGADDRRGRLRPSLRGGRQYSDDGPKEARRQRA
jgi:hypothetical protein